LRFFIAHNSKKTSKLYSVSVYLSSQAGVWLELGDDHLLTAAGKNLSSRKGAKVAKECNSFFCLKPGLIFRFSLRAWRALREAPLKVSTLVLAKQKSRLSSYGKTALEVTPSLLPSEIHMNFLFPTCSVATRQQKKPTDLCINSRQPLLIPSPPVEKIPFL
jgi:hypothetical protein